MSFFSKGRTPGTLGGELSNLADKVNSNRIAERIDQLGPSFIQMGDYSEQSIMNWIKENNVSTEVLKAMKPIIQQYRDSFDRSSSQKRQKSDDKWVAGRRDRQLTVDGQADEDRLAGIVRQKTADGRATNRYNRQLTLDTQADEDRLEAKERQKRDDTWTAGRRKRQGILDGQADELFGQRKTLNEQGVTKGKHEVDNLGKLNPLQQVQKMVAEAQLRKVNQGKQPSIKDQQFQAENAMKDLSSQLGAMGVQVDPEAGIFTIPVNKEGQPDPNVLRMIDQSGFSFTTGKVEKTTNKWFNNDYGIPVYLGSYRGGGQSGQAHPRVVAQPGSASAADFGGGASTGQPAPEGKRLSAADFLNKNPQPAPPGVADIETMAPGDIKSLSTTTNKGVYGTPETYDAPESILTKIQKLASKTQTGQKFGEGPIGYALRATGIEDDLAKQKEISEKLKEKYPKATDDQIAQAILRSRKKEKTKKDRLAKIIDNDRAPWILP